MNILKSSLFGFVVFFLIWNCGNECPENNQIESTTHFSDTLSGFIIADTITYDVIIKNNDSSAVWNEEFLRYIKRNMLIDSIFSGVYSGRFEPYSFFSGEKLSIREVREMEKEDWFSRDAIGKIQFSEVWYSKSGSFSIEKKVYSIVLGVEQFDNFGHLKGYKPVFKIYLN
jgi:hypothetical protein